MTVLTVSESCSRDSAPTPSPHPEWDQACVPVDILVANHKVVVARCVIETARGAQPQESHVVISREHCVGDRVRAGALREAVSALVAEWRLRLGDVHGAVRRVRLAVRGQLVTVAVRAVVSVVRVVRAAGAVASRSIRRPMLVFRNHGR